MKSPLSVSIISDALLNPFLDRQRKNTLDIDSTQFQATIDKIMRELFEVVPCESIFLLLDDPVQSFSKISPRNLTYVAGIGLRAEEIIGLKTVSNQGLIAQCYNTGSLSLLKSENFEKIILDKIHLHAPIQSGLCAPIVIGSTIGVLVLINKKDPIGFTIKDVRMTNILTGYLQMSIQNAIDTKKIQEQTKRDTLTGLYNDRHFHNQLEKEVQKSFQTGSALSLMFLDLDFFKSINDQYGHLVGSQTLKEVSFVIREHMNPDGATLARYGGDEFVGIFPDVSLTTAVEMAEELRKGICEKMFMIQDGTLDQSMITFKGVLSASIGISSLQDHIPKLTDPKVQKNLLIQLADKAMYKAKELGKNQVCVANPVAQE